jgi:hypothetical protein
MMTDNQSLWVDNIKMRLYIKESDEWLRIPRIYHPSHNVYCDDEIEPNTVLSTESDWWYDNDTGIWWCSLSDALLISKSCRIPETMHQTWTSPEQVQYTAVMYNTVKHYRKHCEDYTVVPNCIQLDSACDPIPSYEHPTSITESNGTWIPNRPVYFGVPSRSQSHNEPHQKQRCSKCWWYMSSVTVGELEALYQIDTPHANKLLTVAFGPLHLSTIRALHEHHDVSGLWLASSDRTTPPAFHQFKYELDELVDAP